MTLMSLVEKMRGLTLGKTEAAAETAGGPLRLCMCLARLSEDSDGNHWVWQIGGTVSKGEPSGWIKTGDFLRSGPEGRATRELPVGGMGNGMCPSPCTP